MGRQQPMHLQIWFWDESGFSVRVIRRKNWSQKGKRRQLTGQRRLFRVNVMGGIRESDRKRVGLFIEKGNADIFYEQLQQFYKQLKDEGESQGNLGKNFQSRGSKILIVLDNASYHKRRDIREKIAVQMPNMILEFLPPYSPDFNIIELVWHSCKEYIAHRLFPSVDQLRNLLEKLLNQGELIIKWQRKIKNKDNNHVAT
jgi:transposase